MSEQNMLDGFVAWCGTTPTRLDFFEMRWVVWKAAKRQDAERIAELEEEVAAGNAGLHHIRKNNVELRAKLDALEKQEPVFKPLTSMGQIKAGYTVRFTSPEGLHQETVKEVLNEGTTREEVVYNSRKNYYFITSMVLSGRSWHKNVIYAATKPVPATPANEKQPWPNHNWCVGCSPESCQGCGAEPIERRKQATPAIPEWQLIETAPEATTVFVWRPNAGIDVANKTTVHGLAHWWNKGENEQCYPTHWMSLPAAPKPPTNEGEK